jgi:hypothetical protein
MGTMDGIDAGGLFRDWIGSLASKLFHPDFGLFDTTEFEGRGWLRPSAVPRAPKGTFPSRIAGSGNSAGSGGGASEGEWEPLAQSEVGRLYWLAGAVIALSIHHDTPISVNFAPFVFKVISQAFLCLLCSP